MLRVLTCLTTEHDWRLVILAGFVCFLSSIAAVNLFHRARLTQQRARAIWLVTAGAATGCGIWATHFIAMLAYDPGVSLGYDIGLTAMSLAAAVAVTCSGLAVAVCGSGRWAAPIGGAIVGFGIACMHYTGMWAVQLPGLVTWSPELILGSIGLGMFFAAIALMAAVRSDDIAATLIAAILLTLAIISHHFTAMGAVQILPDPSRVIEATSLSPTALALAIAIAAMALLSMSVGGAIADRRLREQNVRLDSAVNNMSQGLLMFDAAARLVLCNQVYLQLYGLSSNIVKPGCTLRQLVDHCVETGRFSTGDPDQYMPDMRANAVHGITVNNVVDLTDGRTIAVSNRLMPGGGWVATHEDITERKRGEDKFRRTQEFLNTVIENVPATLVVREAREGRYVLINRAGEELYGVGRDEMIGKTAHDLFPKDEADAITRRDNEVLKAGQALVVEDLTVHTPRNGVRLVNSKRLQIPAVDGTSRYVMSFVEDVTDRKRAEERIAHLAHHDPLTNLANRAAFTEQLAATLEDIAEAKQSFAILCIDLDRFKDVNDVFGHAIGDKLLCEVSRRLREAADGAFLARLGGDEFTVIAARGPQPGTAERLAERLLATVADDLNIEGHQLRIGLSIGVAIYPTDGDDPATLLANADAALYRAKAEGRAAIRFFEPEMDKLLRERRALQQDLRSAAENGELSLHYQPQALISGDIIGFEALLRWHHPSHGIIPPDTFIPLAEESGLIMAIGEWVLREACREAQSWPRKLQIAINLSPIQFRHGDLAGLVHSILFETGLSASRLQLEITEGVLIRDFSRAVSILRRLKALGVRIAMDDFGTGYSSMSYLQSFPFDTIKIDQRFISNVDCNAQSAAIVRATVGLARGLNMPVVAEGVETKDQLAFLASETCDEVQGFLVGRPGPIDNYAETVGRPVISQPMSAHSR